MKALCPDCMGALTIDGAGTARCTVHGGTYRVLFNRIPSAEEPVPPQIPLDALAGIPPVGTTPGGFSPHSGKHCVQHPHLPATRQCQACGAFMCETCDFVLPGGMHLCPPCATKPQTELSGKRKANRGWSYGLAAFSTLSMGLSFASAAQGGDMNAIGLAFMLFVMVPAIIGLALGLGAIDRRLSNPMSLWLAAAWNGLIVGLVLLLSIIGTMQE